MISVALRQHRIQLSSGVAVMVVLAALLAWTGHQMTSYLHSTGLAACMAAHGGGCDSFSQLFENRYGGLLRNAAYLNFVPMLVGVFWGAPLIARELETGTYRLAWTQSITRRRWLTSQLAIFVLATVAIGAAFSLLLSWWFHPFAQVQFGGGYSRMDLDSFDFQGVVPIAYSLFAFAVGAAAGVAVRRVLPAMAITFAVYLPLRLWVQSLRAHFAAPITHQLPGAGHQPPSRPWRLGRPKSNRQRRRTHRQRPNRILNLRRRPHHTEGERLLVPRLSWLPPAGQLPTSDAIPGLPRNRVRDLPRTRLSAARHRLLLGHPPLDDVAPDGRKGRHRCPPKTCVAA